MKLLRCVVCADCPLSLILDYEVQIVGSSVLMGCSKQELTLHVKFCPMPLTHSVGSFLASTTLLPPVMQDLMWRSQIQSASLVLWWALEPQSRDVCSAPPPRIPSLSYLLRCEGRLSLAESPGGHCSLLSVMLPRRNNSFSPEMEIPVCKPSLINHIGPTVCTSSLINFNSPPLLSLMGGVGLMTKEDWSCMKKAEQGVAELLSNEFHWRSLWRLRRMGYSNIWGSKRSHGEAYSKMDLQSEEEDWHLVAATRSLGQSNRNFFV